MISTARSLKTGTTGRNGRRFRSSRQKSLFCGCGSAAPAVAGLCRHCYGARRRSALRFDGNRDAVLARDGSRCRACGAGKRGRSLHVHHRRPGIHDPDLLVAVCAACHARIHRLSALRAWLPEPLVALWRERHQDVAFQLQFPLEEAAA